MLINKRIGVYISRNLSLKITASSLLLFFFFIISTNSYSQYYNKRRGASKPEMYFGFRYNYFLDLKIKNNTIVNSNRMGFNEGNAFGFGFYGSYWFNKYIGLQLDIAYHDYMQAYYGADSARNSYVSHVNLKTLDVPIYFSIGRWVYLEGGLSRSFNTNSIYTQETAVGFTQKQVKGAYKPGYWTYSYGAYLKINYEWFGMVAGIRFKRHLTNLGHGIDAQGESIYTFPTTLKLRYLYLGIMFKY